MVFAHLIWEVIENRPNLNISERKQIIAAAPWIMIPICLKGGWNALWDLAAVLTEILWKHMKVDTNRCF